MPQPLFPRFHESPYRARGSFLLLVSPTNKRSRNSDPVSVATAQFNHRDAPPRFKENCGKRTPVCPRIMKESRVKPDISESNGACSRCLWRARPPKWIIHREKNSTLQARRHLARDSSGSVGHQPVLLALLFPRLPFREKVLYLPY